MTQPASLIFSLFDITLAWDMPFGILQYVQCILQWLTSVLLCVSFILADSEKHWFGGCTWWIPLCNGNCPNLSWRFGISKSSWFILLSNKLNMADREEQWILLQFQMITGARSTIHNFHSNYYDYRLTYWTVFDSYRCVMGWTKQTKDTSLSDIIEARGTITLWCGMCGFISQSIFAKKVNKLVYKNFLPE